jgi:hypothetical protein
VTAKGHRLRRRLFLAPSAVPRIVMLVDVIGAWAGANG